MRAALFQTADTPLSVETVVDPTPRPDELILKVSHAGICGSDLHMKQHGVVPPGTVFGHEFAGEIMALGSDAGNRWRVGERVTALPLMPCHHCDACDVHRPGLCASGEFIGTSLERPGAYANYVAVQAAMTQALPNGVTFTEGAMIEPLAVGHHAVERAGIRSGQAVLIIGAGPVGAAVALFARMKGARHVIVSERSADRRQLALDLGATAIIDAANEDVGARFAAITGGKPDTVFECVGVPGLIQEAIGLVALRGQVVVAGVCFQPDPLLPVRALMKEVTVTFSQAYTEADFAAVIDAVAQRRVNASPMHSRTVGFADLPGIFDELGARPRDCKVLLDPSL